MNVLLADNVDLEMWEGWVGDTHSVAATWDRHNQKAQCGFQLFSTWNGHFTLMLLYKGKWQTPVHKKGDPNRVRMVFLQYMSEQIDEANKTDRYNSALERSFKDAHQQMNQWLNEQIKIVKWFNQQR